MEITETNLSLCKKIAENKYIFKKCYFKVTFNKDSNKYDIEFFPNSVSTDIIHFPESISSENSAEANQVLNFLKYLKYHISKNLEDIIQRPYEKKLESLYIQSERTIIQKDESVINNIGYTLIVNKNFELELQTILNYFGSMDNDNCFWSFTFSENTCIVKYALAKKNSIDTPLFFKLFHGHFGDCSIETQKLIAFLKKMGYSSNAKMFKLLISDECLSGKEFILRK